MGKKYLGAMVDCSRNAVLTVDAVKRFIDLMAKMGYNMLMLYTEDTYEVDNQPMFGYLRGRYTKDELKEIVSYGEEKGIELIPCIQTLAHLNQIFRWKDYKGINDSGNVLLCEDEGTYKLIEDMFTTVSECFKSPWVHIGMDEAEALGKGKYRDIHGDQNRFDVLSKHLEKVKEIAEKHGLKPLMWSDMFFKLASGGKYAIEDPDLITPEIAAYVPENVELVYWDYFGKTAERYDTMIKAHKNFNRPVWFAGAVWTWSGFAPRNRMAFDVIRPAMKSCREQQVENVMFTCWGDHGAECSVFHALPALFYAAEIYRGNEDEALIAKRFKEIIGIDFYDFIKLDYSGQPTEEEGMQHESSSERVMLYNDAFRGTYDNMVEAFGGVKERYEGFAKELEALTDNPDYGYLFKSSAALCRLLSAKAELGMNTRKIYESGDKRALAELIEEYKRVEQLVDAFFYAYREEWLHDKKGSGLEVQDVRIGGLRYRLTDCRLRLEDYLNGKIDRIDDLDEKLLKAYINIRYLGINATWSRIISTNIV